MRVRCSFEVEVPSVYQNKEVWFGAMIQDHLNNWDQDAENIKLEMISYRSLTGPELVDCYNRYQEEMLSSADKMTEITFDTSNEQYSVFVGKVISGSSLIVSYYPGTMVVSIGTETAVIQGKQLEKLVEAL